MVSGLLYSLEVEALELCAQGTNQGIEQRFKG
jgi:hypothetical protein